jgi:CheY-like chemotaxis protein
MARHATVLIVEDEDDVRDVAIGYVRALGYGVLAARDGNEALAILKTTPQVDLLLTDIVMPGPLDGFALGRAAMSLRPNLKVLHVTGYGEHRAARRNGLENGAVIAKPYRQEQLRVRFAALLGSWAIDRNATLRRLYRYWLDKRGERPWPDRRAIDPAELKEILPNLAIIEIVGAANEPRFRYRLVGTAIVDAYGVDLTGRFVDEMKPGAHRDFLLGLLREVAATGRGIYAASAFRLADTGLSAERLFLPLSLGNGRVRQIIVSHTHDWSARETVALAIAEQATDRTDTIERLS